ncbi:MAG: hypothetical protein CL748_03770 [Chloroflexi bacterium]|nr:hypothetical protein [Chloroflexota bacterium]
MISYLHIGRNLYKLFLIIFVAFFLFISCENTSNKNYDRNDFTPIPGPPPMPMIFEGNFSICKTKILFFCLKYEPGPENLEIYGEIVHGSSPISKTLNGNYMHVILGPVSIDDNEKKEVSFYLVNGQGDNIKANETWKFSDRLPSPTTIYLDLSFDRLPKEEK